MSGPNPEAKPQSDLFWVVTAWLITLAVTFAVMDGILLVLFWIGSSLHPNDGWYSPTALVITGIGGLLTLLAMRRLMKFLAGV